MFIRMARWSGERRDEALIQRQDRAIYSECISGRISGAEAIMNDEGDEMNDQIIEAERVASDYPPAMPSDPLPLNM